MKLYLLSSILLCLGLFICNVNAACQTVYCKTDPCTFSDPYQCGNHDNVECRANYCGGCNVEWWKDGVMLTDCIDFTLG